MYIKFINVYKAILLTLRVLNKKIKFTKRCFGDSFGFVFELFPWTFPQGAVVNLYRQLFSVNVSKNAMGILLEVNSTEKYRYIVLAKQKRKPKTDI